MGIALVKIKIMPESPTTNLKEIESAALKTIEKDGGKGVKFSQEPIAFGLKAIFASFEWPEEKDLDIVEAKLGQIKNVKSAELADIRRAIG